MKNKEIRAANLQFKNSVPAGKRKALEEEYRRFVREFYIWMFGSGIQTALKVWVENGNNPYMSNRYGFYDSREMKYLDFLRGEIKLCQLLEISAGKRSPAECALNQYGEPLPGPSVSEAKGMQEIQNTGFGLFASQLLDEMKKELSSRKKKK